MTDRLSIHSQLGTLSIQSPHGTMNRRSAVTDLQLEGNSEKTLKIEYSDSELSINQEDSFASVNAGSVLRWAKKCYQIAFQKGSRAIDEIVSEGVRYMQVEKGGNPPKELARQKYDRAREEHLTVKAVQPPRIDYEPGSVDILIPEATTLKADWNRQQSSYQYTPGGVNISWNTKPSITITVVPGTRTGGQMDTTV